MNDTIILGGGLAGLSLAHNLNRKSLILEKEEQIGGLCRSFELNNVYYDIGPHILFSKNEEILKFITSIVETNRIRRSNKIFYKGKFIKYPFENGLSALDEDDKGYCLKEFLDNPHENGKAKTMLQFFLKTFGEGITNLYLKPYNEKIWKFDPALMDTQMVERIPKPPKEDIIKSAEGVETEGYTHQLYFHYPKNGGISSMIESYKNLILKKTQVITGVKIRSISKMDGNWNIITDKGEFICKTLINCMPLHELFGCLKTPIVPPNVGGALNGLRYNSLHIIAIQTKKDNLGDNFAVYFADKGIIFHRISKINFLGDDYTLKNGASTILAEITYRQDDNVADLSDEKIKKRVLADLERLKLVNRSDVINIDLKSFKYAYVIYDLKHRKNADIVRDYLLNIGIKCCGRFAEFEYLNMDQTIERSLKLAEELNKNDKNKR